VNVQSDETIKWKLYCVRVWDLVPSVPVAQTFQTLVMFGKKNTFTISAKEF